jgi:hypothetical protein
MASPPTRLRSNAWTPFGSSMNLSYDRRRCRVGLSRPRPADGRGRRHFR